MNRIGRNDPCPCGSGKKYKQCCAQAQQAPAHRPTSSAAGAPQIAQALQAALEYHQFGRFAEAESIYRQVLRIDPANFDALHLLGVLIHQTGQHAQAVDMIARAIALQPSNALAHNNLGDAYRALGRLDQAVANFEQALVLQPDFHEVHNNLGETYRLMGHLDQAQAALQKVLARKPDYAEAHSNLGLTLHAQGKLDEALASFQKAVSIKPDYAKAHVHLGAVYQDIGQVADAINCFDQALSLKADYPEALFALSTLFKQQGQLKKSLLCCQRLLQAPDAKDAYWRLYADILQLLSADMLDAIDQPILLQGFGQAAIDPQKLERIATAMVCRDPLVRELVTWANEAPDGASRIDAALSDGALSPLLESPLLLALLEEALVTDYRLEKLLVLIRQALLAFVVGPNVPQLSAHEKFGCCLALQCFANEYLYTVSAEEEAALDALTGRIAQALEKQTPCTATWLAILASYRPLHSLPFAGKICAASWPQAHVQALVLRQLSQPLQEESIKREIPGLTGVTDAVSQAVRQQYEENPYPRWRRRGGHASLATGQSLKIALQRRLPHQAFPDNFPQSPQILVAGCGTGSDAFQVAQAFGNAEILAVDISKTSLAYAQRATQEFGIDHIDFRQADILELGSLDRQFDLIVCSGVLHHMRDPMAGWRVLSGLLRPDGYMNIGLYSRRARQEIAALRQLVANQGYPSTRAGISRFRSDVMRADAPIKIGSIAISPDFYSTSACRDLIFHVQEHVFSPLEIQACLDQLGLQFLGFEFANPETRTPYAARFPDNPACDSLANWELVEQDNPEIFAGMYQFWVKKRA